MSEKKFTALRGVGSSYIKIIGGQYSVDHDGSGDAIAIDMINCKDVEMIDVVARVTNQQQSKLLKEIELLLIQQRKDNLNLNLKIDAAIDSINDLRNANQDTITSKVSDLIIKLASLSELGVNALELITKVSEAFQ